MHRTSAFVLVAVTLLAACGDDSPGTSVSTAAPQPAAAEQEEGVFDGYLQAMDKAKASQEAAADRQNRMDAMLGYEPGETAMQTLGMTESRLHSANDYEQSDGFFGEVQAQINKAKATRDMLNDRTQQMDRLAGGSFESVVDQQNGSGNTEKLSMDARAARDQLNARMRELEAIATGNYEEDYESF